MRWSFAAFSLAALLLGTGIPAAGGVIELTGTVRDFNDTHPDFEIPWVIPPAWTLTVDPDIVGMALGGDGTPVYAGAPTTTTTHGAAAFAPWYHDTPGTNLRGSHTITLQQVGGGTTYAYDSDAFFPIDDKLFGNQGRDHNFHFTYEIHTAFTYEVGQSFTFSGDDDLWVFINGHRVIDLGGVHIELSDSVDLDSVAGAIGITPGGTYDFDLFYAERHTTASNFHLETSIPLQPVPPAIPEPATALVLVLGAAFVATRRSR